MSGRVGQPVSLVFGHADGRPWTASRTRSNRLPPIDKDLYDLPPERPRTSAGSHQLSAVIDRLEDDHEYLTEGGVFTPDLIETWISYKRNYELAPYNLHPTPYEFALYYDV